MNVLRQTFQFGSTTILNSLLSLETDIMIPSSCFDKNGGVLVINRINSHGLQTPEMKEFISFTGIEFDGNWVLKGVERGQYGTPARAHVAGSIIEAVPLIILENIKSDKERLLGDYLKKIL